MPPDAVRLVLLPLQIDVVAGVTVTGIVLFIFIVISSVTVTLPLVPQPIYVICAVYVVVTVGQTLIVGVVPICVSNSYQLME